MASEARRASGDGALRLEESKCGRAAVRLFVGQEPREYFWFTFCLCSKVP